MSEAVSDALSVDKTGCRLAAALEEGFAAAGWPSGELYDCEDSVCRRYGVSRRIYREAVRVLTMRGTARLRRGARPGLVVTAPDPELTADILRGYAYLIGVTEAHRTQAIDFLDRVCTRMTGHDPRSSASDALVFLSRFLREQLHPGMPPIGVAKEKFRKTRAGQIAIKHLEQHVATAFTPGRRVGSEQQLSEQYSADRSITRQAIRLMESSGLISSQPGRGNGLITMQPPSGPVCRLLCCYFAAQKLPVPAAFDLFEAMSIETVVLCAQTAEPRYIESLQAILAGRRAEAWQLSDMIAVEDALYAGVSNPLIDLMLRSIRGYVAVTIAQDDKQVPVEVATCFSDHMQRLLTALSHNDAAAAIEVQTDKLSRIRELEQRYHPALAGLLRRQAPTTGIQAVAHPSR